MLRINQFSSRLLFKALLYYGSQTSRKQGFVLPTLVMLGLIMTVIGMTMIGRSSDAEQTSISQKHTANVLALAETGNTRTLAGLQGTSFLKLNYNSKNSPKTQWEDDSLHSLYQPPCETLPPLSGTIDSYGSYTVVSYEYLSSSETGILTMRGDSGTATSQVQIEVPIAEQTINGTFPGLYASNHIDMGNNDVVGTGTGESANVVCKDCNVSNPTTECSAGQPTQGGLESSIGQKQNSIIDGDILLNQVQLPPLPTAPADAISVGAIKSSMNLPRLGDDISADGEYHYIVDSIALSGGEILTVDTTGAPVSIYLAGDMTLNGGEINHTNTGVATDFSIYGNPDNGDPNNKETFTFNGNTTLGTVFLYAPNANIAIQGGASSSTTNITGSVWVNEWDGSKSNNAILTVPDEMAFLIQNKFPDWDSDGILDQAGVLRNVSGPATRWQRESVN